MIAFIGVGNMGGTLARAAVKSVGPEKVFVTSRTIEKARDFAASCGCRAVTNAEAAQTARYLFLGVKPQMMRGVLSELAPVLRARGGGFVLVTMAAGLSMRDIDSMAGGGCRVIRIMPNTPAAVGAGMIPYCANDAVTPEELGEFCRILRCAGRLDPLPERLIDAAGALSGCGPAFVYVFLEALADAAVACGLPRDKALSYAAQTVLGSAEMVLETRMHPAALKDAVCSPAGSTIEGVHALEEGGFRAAAENAVLAAYRRSLELGK